MDVSAILLDGFHRIRDQVMELLDGASAADLVERIDPDANTICWLVWHLTRVQDDHIAGVAGTEQIWVKDGFADRLGLDLDRLDIGYGHESGQVARVKAGKEDLADYHDAVYEATRSYVSGLSGSDLDRVVDERWDPPVTLGVRLVSVLSDDLQHVGQAAFVAGVLDRR